MSAVEVKARLVIIGAGHAGLGIGQFVAKKLGSTNSAKITLISENPFVYQNIAGPRALVEPSILERMIFKLDLERAFKKPKAQVELIVGHALRIDRDGKSVLVKVTESGEEQAVPFDYLVVATGSSYTSPFKAPSSTTADKWKETILGHAEQVKNSKSFLIIGGGPLGVEVACELKNEFPDRSVTIVHKHEQLVHLTYPKAIAKLNQNIKELGVNTILNDSIASVRDEPDFKIPTEIEKYPAAKTFVTSKGVQVEADMVFPCTGAPPNSQIFRDSPQLASSLDSHGRVIVDGSFQVKDGQGVIFAIGDVCNSAETKLVFAIRGHVSYLGPFLAASIKAKCSGKPAPNLPSKPYQTIGYDKAFVAMGRSRGIGVLSPSFVLGNFAMRQIKTKKMFYDKLYQLYYS